MFLLSCIAVSDWVLISTSLFLGACCIFVPYVSELLKRKWFAPEIEIDFQLVPPFCHKTRRGSGEPVYYFRFIVENEGKTRANNCEMYLEKLWTCDASQTPVAHPNFFPVNMGWSGNRAGKYLDINPYRRVYCDIGHISSKKYQFEYEKKSFVDLRESNGDELRFMFELPEYFFSQPNCLLPGRYIIQVGFYSENAGTQKAFFEISWSGKWHEEQSEMFKEIVIKRVSEPK